MILEMWFIELMNDIKKASEQGTSFDLHLDPEQVKDVSEAYNTSKWIEIY